MLRIMHCISLWKNKNLLLLKKALNKFTVINA